MVGQGLERQRQGPSHMVKRMRTAVPQHEGSSACASDNAGEGARLPAQLAIAKPDNAWRRMPPLAEAEEHRAVA